MVLGRFQQKLLSRQYIKSQPGKLCLSFSNITNVLTNVFPWFAMAECKKNHPTKQIHGWNRTGSGSLNVVEVTLGSLFTSCINNSTSMFLFGYYTGYSPIDLFFDIWIAIPRHSMYGMSVCNKYQWINIYIYVAKPKKTTPWQFFGWWKSDPFKGCWWPPTIRD